MDRQTSGLVIALDVGGTSVKSAVVAKNGDLIGEPKRTPVDNQASADAILNTFTAIIQAHLAELSGAQLLGVAFGFPGPLDKEAGISFTANKGFTDVAVVSHDINCKIYSQFL